MEPRYTGPAPEQKLMLLDFLDARRQAVLGKVGAMPYEAMASSTLPSGWTPLGIDIVAELLSDAQQPS